MANEMMAVQHSCEGLLKFILLEDTETVDMEVMTLKAVLIFKQDKHSSENSFIPWSVQTTPPSAFLKRVRETQTKNSKEFLESILDWDLEPNFRPKQSCRCPQVTKAIGQSIHSWHNTENECKCYRDYSGQYSKYC